MMEFDTALSVRTYLVNDNMDYFQRKCMVIPHISNVLDGFTYKIYFLERVNVLILCKEYVSHTVENGYYFKLNST